MKWILFTATLSPRMCCSIRYNSVYVYIYMYVVYIYTYIYMNIMHRDLKPKNVLLDKVQLIICTAHNTYICICMYIYIYIYMYIYI